MQSQDTATITGASYFRYIQPYRCREIAALPLRQQTDLMLLALARTHQNHPRLEKLQPWLLIGIIVLLSSVSGRAWLVLPMLLLLWFILFYHRLVRQELRRIAQADPATLEHPAVCIVDPLYRIPALATMSYRQQIELVQQAERIQFRRPLAMLATLVWIATFFALLYFSGDLHIVPVLAAIYALLFGYAWFVRKELGLLVPGAKSRRAE